MAKVISGAVGIATAAFQAAFARWETAKGRLAQAENEFIGIGMSKSDAKDKSEEMFGGEIETTQRIAAQLCDVMRTIEADERESVN